MGPARRLSVGRSPFVRKQSQITTFFSPGKTSSPNPNPTASKEKQKKPLLIPSPGSARKTTPTTGKKPLQNQAPGSDSKTPPTAGKTARPDAAIGKRVRVFWPLDKTWYEGRVKSFDESSGKHVVQYDDAEEEVLDLGSEKIEWVAEEAPRSLRRLRRLSTSSVVSMECDEEGSGGDDSSEDEDWAKGTGKDAANDDDSEEVELEEEEEVMGKKSRSGRGTSFSVGSVKRKKIEVDRLGCSKKFKFDGDEGGERSASVPPVSKTPTNKSRFFATGNAESKHVSLSQIFC